MLRVSLLLMLATALVAQDVPDEAHLKKALKLHKKYLVLDTHSDVTPKFHEASWNFAERHKDGHMDIPRLRDAGFDAQFLSIYMGKTPGDGRAIKEAIRRIDAVYQTVAKHPQQLGLATTASEVRRLRGEGRIACLMGVEGGHIIEDSLAALRMFHQLGVRYMTLAHSFNSHWADSSGAMEDVDPEFGGLSEPGKDLIREMNRLGMMVDISHVSDATFWDAMKISKAPLIASHSSTKGVFPHRRNMSDEMLKAMADKGGIIMINFFSAYIDPEWESYSKAWEEEHNEALKKLAGKFKANRRAYWHARSAFQQEHPMKQTKLLVLARHVEHAAKVAGWDHVGMGADWDGVNALPEGIRHCGDTIKLTALLLQRGATEEQIRGFLGENFLRTMEKVEALRW